MARVTMTDTAYSCMSKRKKEIEFARLWDEVAKAMNIPPEQLARKKRQFYSELMMDNRFAALKDNKWDLRARRKFDEMHADDNLEDDEDSDNDERDEEEPLDIPHEKEEF